MDEMTTTEPLLDDGDTTDLTEAVFESEEELRTYPGRYLASTVALTLESLHTAALAELAGLQGHGCAAEAQRSRCLGRADAVVELWGAFGLPSEELTGRVA